ncbi:hypothetical protein HGI30_13285 [Paenibacillus albicereus]|uniref:Uncharacterized protein n=1 Tax=Paenibacillus albicereus TaxID=2726185 RepID=A0A6H2GZ96_9BACL|nr:hypothetical protein [Paenibacillus albicereus]QJC52438.1 hypothetical protein HGI30_13285 [Paenibacillus albicereus]
MLVLRLLSEPAHFQQAVEEKWTVSVYKDSRLLVSGYPIEMFNRDTVKIAGTYFFMEECKFEGCRIVPQQRAMIEALAPRVRRRKLPPSSRNQASDS